MPEILRNGLRRSALVIICFCPFFPAPLPIRSFWGVA